MIGQPSLRRDRRAFSAFYGAFAVLLAAMVVLGALAAVGPGGAGSSEPRVNAAADDFLGAVLASTEPGTGGSLLGAMSRLCLEAECSNAPSPAQFLDRASALAENLSSPMGARYGLILTVDGSTVLHAGPLDPAPGLPMARREVFHPGLQGFVDLTLFLAVP